MVGEGVLNECMNHPEVESILVINRRASGIYHPKVSEILHEDFNNISGIAEILREYSTCFFCSGISSVGKKEEEFEKLTYTLTINFAEGIKKSGASNARTDKDIGGLSKQINRRDRSIYI